MKEWLNSFLYNVYNDISTKQHCVWLNKKNVWPTESTLSLSISKAISQQSIDCYGEIKISGNQRIDLLLINYDQNWIMHVELKRMLGNKLNSICNDLERIQRNILQDLIESASPQPQINLQSFRRFGLFLGISADDCWTIYEWWSSPTSEEIRRTIEKVEYKYNFTQGLFEKLDFAYKSSISWGCIPNSINKLKPISILHQNLAISYGLFEL